VIADRHGLYRALLDTATAAPRTAPLNFSGNQLLLNL
jgi:hypothetical protein